jgi:hypothetical protein
MVGVRPQPVDEEAWETKAGLAAVPLAIPDFDVGCNHTVAHSTTR